MGRPYKMNPNDKNLVVQITWSQDKTEFKHGKIKSSIAQFRDSKLEFQTSMISIHGTEFVMK